MKLITSILLGLTLLSATPALAKDPKPQPVNVPAGVDHGTYDRLLNKYVNKQGLVAYAKWRNDSSDRQALDSYLQQFARSDSKAEGNEKAASLANAYNAFTIQWILQNYPTESIWQLDNSFTAPRHKVGGKEVSLNDLEKGTLNKQVGYKDHAVLVCAARSCPPLSREAYSTDEFDAQVDQAYTRWLARPDLNEFKPADKAVKISVVRKRFRESWWRAEDPRALRAREVSAISKAHKLHRALQDL